MTSVAKKSPAFSEEASLKGERNREKRRTEGGGGPLRGESKFFSSGKILLIGKGPLVRIYSKGEKVREEKGKPYNSEKERFAFKERTPESFQEQGRKIFPKEGKKKGHKRKDLSS